MLCARTMGATVLRVDMDHSSWIAAHLFDPYSRAQSGELPARGRIPIRVLHPERDDHPGQDRGHALPDGRGGRFVFRERFFGIGQSSPRNLPQKGNAGGKIL